MKRKEQVFCACGKGRAFLVATGHKRELQGIIQEWLDRLTRDGWMGVDLDRERATKCNRCFDLDENEDKN